MSETIADRIDTLRLPGETSAALARRAGVTKMTMMNILHGNEPKNRTLQTIAEHLGCTAVYLRYGVGETSAPNTQAQKKGQSCQA
jgi:transcriptional regulator with XRE-family HTH domain